MLSANAIGGMSIAFSFLISMVGGLLSFGIVYSAKAEMIVVYSSAFGSGIIVATALVHMLMDASQDFSESSFKYNYAFAMFGGGFILLYIVENILMARFLKRYGSNANELNLHVHSHAMGDRVLTTVNTDNFAQDTAAEVGKDFGESKDKLGVSERSKKLKSYMFAACLLIIISIHAAFEGLSLGIHEKPTSIMIAICGHKAVEGFVICNSFAQSKMSTKFSLLLLVIFSLVTPLFIAIGMIVRNCISNNHSDTIAIVEAFVISFSSGTFFYVGSALLQENGDDSHGHSHNVAKVGQIRKISCWIVGFIFMAIICEVVPKE